MAVPKPITDEIFDSINQLINKDEYQSDASFEIKRLFAQISKLMPVDPAWANLAKGFLYFIVADFENGKYHIEVGNKLPTENRDSLNANSSIAYSNSSFYSDGQKYYSLVKEVASIEQYLVICGGFNSLAFHKLNELIVDAKKLNIEFEKNDVEIASKASSILSAAQITDAEVAKYADVFGEVLRENRLLVTSKYPTVIIGDDTTNWHPHTVFVVFKVKSNATTAAKLYKESVKRLIARYGAIPDALHFSIEAV